MSCGLTAAGVLHPVWPIDGQAISGREILFAHCRGPVGFHNGRDSLLEFTSRERQGRAVRVEVGTMIQYVPRGQTERQTDSSWVVLFALNLALHVDACLSHYPLTPYGEREDGA